MSSNTITKHCRKCNTTKPVSKFHKCRSKACGYVSSCKSCKTKYAKRRWVLQNINKPRRILIQSPEKRAYSRKYMRKWRNGHNEQIKAVNAVNHAIRDGIILRADEQHCWECGLVSQEYHHILGYKPKHRLDVIPLCRICHNKIHRKIRA